MYLPLGENLTNETGGLSSSMSVFKHWPEAVSQIRLQQIVFPIRIYRRQWQRNASIWCGNLTIIHRNCSKLLENHLCWNGRQRPGPNGPATSLSISQSWRPRFEHFHRRIRSLLDSIADWNYNKIHNYCVLSGFWGICPKTMKNYINTRHHKNGHSLIVQGLGLYLFCTPPEFLLPKSLKLPNQISQNLITDRTHSNDTHRTQFPNFECLIIWSGHKQSGIAAPCYIRNSLFMPRNCLLKLPVICSPYFY